MSEADHQQTKKKYTWLWILLVAVVVMTAVILITNYQKRLDQESQELEPEIIQID